MTDPATFAAIIAKERNWPSDYDLTDLAEFIRAFSDGLAHEHPLIKRDCMVDVVTLKAQQIESGFNR